jgi:hypothetical protein
MPWELPPASLGEGGVGDVIGLDANSMELPDGRHAELYRLSFYHAIGTRHFARFAQDYVGIESENQFLWGGGRTEAQWTSQLGPTRGRRVALEAIGSLSTGEEKLHPLSAGAPSLQMRVRAQWFGAGPIELWTGASARLVSPPGESDRQAPRSAFPSGNSLDATFRWARGRWESQAQLRYDAVGLPKSWWASWTTVVPMGQQLSLRVAGHAGFGPVESRMIDNAWTLGVTWQPAPDLSEPSTLR